MNRQDTEAALDNEDIRFTYAQPGNQPADIHQQTLVYINRLSGQLTNIGEYDLAKELATAVISIQAANIELNTRSTNQ